MRPSRIIADLVLSPNPMPSANPAPQATIFYGKMEEHTEIMIRLVIFCVNKSQISISYL